MNSTRLLDDEPGEVPVSVMQAYDELSAPTHADIAELAYSFWEARGRRGGSPWEDWFHAEGEWKERDR